MMKQIIIITDGCSNVGVSPVVAAAHAFAEGIVVNVIGVVDQGELGERGAAEIAEIAKAGGGMSRIVTSAFLAKTMQMVTRKTMAHTIGQVVSQKLQHILGEESSIDALPPGKRAQVVEVIDELSETSGLRVALLIDASASMKAKLAAVKDAINDLMLSIQARKGESELAVFHFPGSAEHGELEMDMDWTKNLANFHKLFYKLNMKGTTPTGPALMRLVRLFTGNVAEPQAPAGYDESSEELVRTAVKDGIWSDYVV